MPRYELEGEGDISEDSDVEEFIGANDFDEEMKTRLRALQPGEKVIFGGGAAPVYIFRRVN